MAGKVGMPHEEQRVPTRRAWAIELAVRLEQRADDAERGAEDRTMILCLRALGEMLRRVEASEARGLVIEAKLDSLLKRGARP